MTPRSELRRRAVQEPVDFAHAYAELEAENQRLTEALRKSTRSYSRRGRHLPFCPGSLSAHTCWPECEQVRAALASTEEPA